MSKCTTALTFLKFSEILGVSVSASVSVPVPVSVSMSVPGCVYVYVYVCLCLCLCLFLCLCQARGALRCLARDDEQNRALIAQSIDDL